MHTKSLQDAIQEGQGLTSHEWCAMGLLRVSKDKQTLNKVTK
jgi:hypothetical protein